MLGIWKKNNPAFKEPTTDLWEIEWGGRQPQNRAVRRQQSESPETAKESRKGRGCPASKGEPREASWKGDLYSSCSHFHVWLSPESLITSLLPPAILSSVHIWTAPIPTQSFKKKVYLDSTSFQEKNVRQTLCSRISRHGLGSVDTSVNSLSPTQFFPSLLTACF